MGIMLTLPQTLQNPLKFARLVIPSILEDETSFKPQARRMVTYLWGVARIKIRSGRDARHTIMLHRGKSEVDGNISGYFARLTGSCTYNIMRH